MKITSQGWTIAATKSWTTSAASMVITEPDGNVHNLSLTDVHVKGGVLTGTASVLFWQVAVTITQIKGGINVNLAHSWFGDGDHKFLLNADDIAQVVQFFKGYS